LWLLAACAPQAALPAAQPKLVPTTAPVAPTTAQTKAEPFKVGFIYVAPVGDLGWNYQHDLGRQYLQKELGDKVITTAVENVPEGADVERVLRDFASKGYGLIFATSYGYMDPTIAVAKDFPKTWFIHISGFKRADNVSTVFARMHEARYLSGLIAGKMTKPGAIIGCVCSFPLPLTLSELNAFMIGVRENNPTATLRIVWTSTWFDPPKEKEAAEALVSQGATFLIQYQDTPEPQKVAKEHGLYSIGLHSDMRPVVGDSVLTSVVWVWGPKYVEITKAVMNGKYKSEDFWGGLKEGAVDLAPYSPKVPQDVRDLVTKKRQEIIDGKFDIFVGPLKDQNGKMHEHLDHDQIWNMDWLLDSVSTPLPK
jgi:basic membrane protein A